MLPRGKFLREYYLFSGRELFKGTPPYLFLRCCLHISPGSCQLRNEMALKATSENLRGCKINIARLLKELMGFFDLDKKIGIWISCPFRWLLESAEAKLNKWKKVTYSQHAAKSSLEITAWVVCGIPYCVPVSIVLEMIIVLREEAKQGVLSMFWC